ncbi:MAG: metallophosphoesterase [Candidatus Tantalella remota]|nr:metallophosphoesterase [Candidatus Tantalella remota]
MRNLVIGDIHGNYRGLLQCFKRSGFDYKKDRLISLGDLCDRNTENREVVDELLKVQNFSMVIGNHDLWLVEWVENKQTYVPTNWAFNGGTKTMESYNFKNVPDEHLKLINEAKTLIQLDDKIIVHGGLDINKDISEQDRLFAAWDRTFLRLAYETSKNDPDKRFFNTESIFIGHTPTTSFSDLDIPQKLCNVWCLDTGSGYSQGKLTIMNIDTEEYWQSDSVSYLYP